MYIYCLIYYVQFLVHNIEQTRSLLEKQIF